LLLVSLIVFTAIHVAADLLYAWLDPRIRYS
jgi:ABC-type dipeptide/oligopeptide/nickel transport system permease component